VGLEGGGLGVEDGQAPELLPSTILEGQEQLK
jgi:hypothetical protein